MMKLDGDMTTHTVPSLGVLGWGARLYVEGGDIRVSPGKILRTHFKFLNESIKVYDIHLIFIF